VERLRCIPDLGAGSIRVRATARLDNRTTYAELDITALDPDTHAVVASTGAAVSPGIAYQECCKGGGVAPGVSPYYATMLTVGC